MGENYPSLPVLDKGALDTVKEQFPSYAPTTWEAIQAKKEQYLAKSDDERKRLRPICVMVVLKVPEGQKVAMINPSYNITLELQGGTYLTNPWNMQWSYQGTPASGAMMSFSALDFPPNIFGTEENSYSPLLIDPETREPRQATILMSYFAPPLF